MLVFTDCYLLLILASLSVRFLTDSQAVKDASPQWWWWVYLLRLYHYRVRHWISVNFTMQFLLVRNECVCVVVERSCVLYPTLYPTSGTTFCIMQESSVKCWPHIFLLPPLHTHTHIVPVVIMAPKSSQVMMVDQLGWELFSPLQLSGSLWSQRYVCSVQLMFADPAVCQVHL